MVVVGLVRRAGSVGLTEGRGRCDRCCARLARRRCVRAPNRAHLVGRVIVICSVLLRACRRGRLGDFVTGCVASCVCRARCGRGRLGARAFRGGGRVVVRYLTFLGYGLCGVRVAGASNCLEVTADAKCTYWMQKVW